MNIRLVFGTLVPLAIVGACVIPEQAMTVDQEWISLFDGETLDGWTQVNGNAPYEVVDGAIRGTNVLDTPNSFLATENTYSDFVLEYDSRSEGPANSGVQFRTDLAPGTWSGVVGYQLDIDPSDRKWTGGIYHEGVHVWRHSMARNHDCQSAYKHGEWNTYRIEAVGNVMATWVNGVSCAHMIGDHHDSGMIALQVHSIGQEASYLGSLTEWRDIRILIDPDPKALLTDTRNPLVEGWLVGRLSAAETQAGWQQVALSGSQTPFEIPNETFELVFDVQLGNEADGVLEYSLSSEAQRCVGHYHLFDDQAAGSDRLETERIGSFTGKLAAENLSEPGRPKRYNSDQKWNRIRLLADRQWVQHWLNGVKVVDYSRCDPAITDNRPDLSNENAQPALLELRVNGGQINLRDAKYRSLTR